MCKITTCLYVSSHVHQGHDTAGWRRLIDVHLYIYPRTHLQAHTNCRAYVRADHSSQKLLAVSFFWCCFCFLIRCFAGSSICLSAIYLTCSKLWPLFNTHTWHTRRERDSKRSREGGREIIGVHCLSQSTRYTARESLFEHKHEPGRGISPEVWVKECGKQFEFLPTWRQP